MSARAVLSLLLCLSLLLPVAGSYAHAPDPGGSTADSAGAMQDLAAGTGGCHADGKRSDPTGEPTTPAPGPQDCCPTCDCDCTCPAAGKAMAIGPAHLALVAVPAATGPLAAGRESGTGVPPLRPPIVR